MTSTVSIWSQNDIPFEVLVEVFQWLPVRVIFQTVRFVSSRWRDASSVVLRKEARQLNSRCLRIRRTKLLSKPPALSWNVYLGPVEGLKIPYYLGTPKLKDIGGIGQCQSLSHLDLYGTSLTDQDMIHLANLECLRTLIIACTAVSNISVLSTCTALMTLSASQTRIQDVSPLAGLRGLHTIDISQTPVSDVSSLTNMPSLHLINLSGTPARTTRPTFRRGVIVGVA